MKNLRNTNLVIRSSSALALAIWSPSPVQAQAVKAAEEKKKMMEGKMMRRCQEMKEQKQKMKEDMRVQDAQLTEQIAKMNRAPEDRSWA